MKLMRTDGTKHTLADMAELRRRGARVFVIRAPDTRLPGLGRFRGAGEYADLVIAECQPFVDAGAQYVELDTEPQWNWFEDGFGPMNYQEYMRGVVQALGRWPELNRVRLVSPPLSFSPGLWRPRSGDNPHNPGPFTLDDWSAAYQWSDYAQDKPPLYSLFDVLGATVYWGSARHRLDPSYGRGYMTVHHWFGRKRVLVTEFGLSTPDAMSAAERERQMAAAYPLWLAHARMSGVVVGSIMFIHGGTPDWWKFVPTDAVLRATGGATP